MSSTVSVRPMTEDDLDAADRVTRLAFGTVRGLPDPITAFGDTDRVRTRFRAAPESAWVAVTGEELVGAVFAARWGSFGFFGPLAVDPDWWDRGIGSLLLEPVLAAFARWEVRQAGLFTFPSSAKHLGLYQKHGFWPGHLVVVLEKPVAAHTGGYTLRSEDPGGGLGAGIRELTHSVFAGLDLEREISAVSAQSLGDTVLLTGDRVDGLAVCHCGAGSEAGSGACYVKVGAVRPGEGAGNRFERLLDACEDFAAAAGLERLVAGVDTGRVDAYRRLLERGFRSELIGVSMSLRPGEPSFDRPGDYVLSDLR